jgi:hypothetical protein
MAQVLSIIASAFLTGALARFAVPGPDPMPIWLTVLIGLLGTLAGAGIVVLAIGADAEWMGIAGFAFSIALVLGYRRFVQKRAIWGPDAYRFPERGVGVPEFRQRLEKAGIDPDKVGSPFQLPQVQPAPAVAGAAAAVSDAPSENPAHYLGLLEELHDHGVLLDDEYESARRRLLESLRA